MYETTMRSSLKLEHHFPWMNDRYYKRKLVQQDLTSIFATTSSNSNNNKYNVELDHSRQCETLEPISVVDAFGLGLQNDSIHLTSASAFSLGIALAEELVYLISKTLLTKHYHQDINNITTPAHHAGHQHLQQHHHYHHHHQPIIMPSNSLKSSLYSCTRPAIRPYLELEEAYHAAREKAVLHALKYKDTISSTVELIEQLSNDLGCNNIDTISSWIEHGAKG
jgi:hypothetical protein